MLTKKPSDLDEAITIASNFEHSRENAHIVELNMMKHKGFMPVQKKNFGYKKNNFNNNSTNNFQNKPKFNRFNGTQDKGK